MKQPLAFRMRPETTKDLLGQSHLLGPGKVITKCLDAGRLFSMIFYGQPGTGKTTMAMCLANELNLPYRLFNAVTGNKKDLEVLFQEAKLSNGLVVIIDEIHRLNKDKQDLLLPHVENGSITLIGATTSNPYFAINPAIRSRCHLFEIKPLTTEDIITALNRAIQSEKGLNGAVTIDHDAAKIIAEHSGGDLRYALNVLEICAIACDGNITSDLVRQYSARPILAIDAGDDGHYDAVSAFQKSIRGSDVNAALYYLARLIEAGDMDSIERRLLVTAYEDIGLGNPAAVARTVNAIDAAKRVGFPEGRIPLANAVIDLALSPKSKSAEAAIDAAAANLREHAYPIPEYLRYTPVNLAVQDRYDYGAPELWPLIQYLPNAIRNEQFYVPEMSGQYEKQLAKNYEELSKIKRSNSMRDLKNRNRK
ncbi:MAG: replication-associated recombination protein A [Erysipelotrichaceae bacterium]|nr:replication-associated recombination protein A [Erysipelotrichaceae bacterium]